MPSLRERWQNLWQALGVDVPPMALLAALGRRYSKPQRTYHTLEHIGACLGHFDDVRVQLERPLDVELAIWFHDAIHAPRRSDNEERSARWAQDALSAAGLEPAAAQRVADLIRLTTHDQAPDSLDAKLLLDIDLTILGADAQRFERYEEQIRREYAWVPWPEFCRVRAAILRAFLQRQSIYHSEHFTQRLEQQARVNLKRSLACLILDQHVDEAYSENAEDQTDE